MKVLVVEDERAIAEFIKDGLEEEGYHVTVAYNGRDGLTLATQDSNAYDILLLDWMLPGMNGLELCRKVRSVNKHIPIIFLTAKDTTDDVVAGLEMGANDYLKKPFAFEELLARIRVLLRKNSETNHLLTVNDILLNNESHEVTKAGKPIQLTQKEFALLEYLLRNKGKVCRRYSIIEQVWDIHFDKDDAVIDVFINSLRKKLDIAGEPSFVQTIRGVGFKINHELDI
jgi:two-component system copper resistance phosphate regulon response regulator CusR